MIYSLLDAFQIFRAAIDLTAMNMKPAKNDPCSCGSGKKYKHCCEGKAASRVLLPASDEVMPLVALYNARRYAELEERARHLVDRHPNFGFGWKLLGAALQMQGRNAVPAFRKAAELMPGEAEVLYNLGVALKGFGQLDDAAESYRRALKLNPAYAEAYSNLGNVLRDLGKLDEAAASYRNALKIKPDSATAHNNLGTALKDLGNLEAAIESYRRALEIKPDYAEAHTNLGNVQKDLGQFDEALKSYRRALEIDPRCDEAMLGISHLCVINGEMNEAQALVIKALEIKPDNLEARFLLANTRKAQAGDENLAALLAVEEKSRSSGSPLPDKTAISLHFALGKCFDDLGDPDQAFPHFIEGCKLRRATFKYDAARVTQHFNEVIRVFDKATLARLRGGGNPSRVPIFVLGMPRSGTTLTEQIIASHPDVYGAGELPDMLRIVQREVAGKSRFPGNILALDQENLARWGDDYVAGLRKRAPDALHITDKLPDNFMFIGLIHVMLPNAKIIHVNRNPVDTCLSCFTKLSSRGLEQSYDLTELGRYYVDYARLMDHWRDVLPAGAFLDVQYEDIVAGQETQARRIIEFCGLEWNDACIDFHKHKRAVNTASMTQVRRPIYKSSLERWRAYEKYLGPLLDALGDLAPKRS
ncbi:MAG: sulfotransferase [Gallionella sp.]